MSKSFWNDPYRGRPSERQVMSVCAWCKHFTKNRSCLARVGTKKPLPHPVEGYESAEIAGENCYMKNEKGECPDYSPSLITRLLRREVLRG